MSRIGFLWGILLTGLGCMSQSTETVPSNLFNKAAPEPAPRRVNFAPAAPEVSMRVDCIGRKILAANPQIGMKPIFATIGDPKPEIFHQGTSMVYVTGGLVGMCQTEGQLAALLSQELGKMVRDREARTTPATREPGGLPPVEVVMGQAGGYPAPDMSHVAAMARFEQKHPRHPNPPTLDPRALAQTYLEKAGYHPSELPGISPLLDAADKNFNWERQIRGGPGQGHWTP